MEFEKHILAMMTRVSFVGRFHVKLIYLDHHPPTQGVLLFLCLFY